MKKFLFGVMVANAYHNSKHVKPVLHGAAHRAIMRMAEDAEKRQEEKTE